MTPVTGEAASLFIYVEYLCSSHFSESFQINYKMVTHSLPQWGGSLLNVQSPIRRSPGNARKIVRFNLSGNAAIYLPRFQK